MNQTDVLQELLTLGEAAQLLRIPEATLRSKFSREPWDVPTCVRFGRRILFRRQDLDAYVQARLAPAPVPPTPVTVRRRA